LDRQNKDLRAKIADLDAQLKSNKKATVQALESRIANLEDQLEAESRYAAARQKLRLCSLQWL
jgi:BMFP domain-containing protein YqiC